MRMKQIFVQPKYTQCHCESHSCMNSRTIQVNWKSVGRVLAERWLGKMNRVAAQIWEAMKFSAAGRARTSRQLESALILSCLPAGGEIKVSFIFVIIHLQRDFLSGLQPHELRCNAALSPPCWLLTGGGVFMNMQWSGAEITTGTD